MKPSVVLSKTLLTLLVAMLIISISSCSTADIEIYTSDGNYTIAFRDSSFFRILVDSQLVEPDWSEEFSFNIIELRDMEDYLIQKTANRSIRGAMMSWISGKVVNASSADLSIICHSNKYLSFVNTFEYGGRRYDYINDYITIDMRTGHRVMLNDLIEINDEFVAHIQKNNIARESRRNIMADDNHEAFNNYLKQLDPVDLLKMLEECSFTQEQVIDEGYYPIDESIGALIIRNSFYLQNNRLILVLQHGGDIHIELLLDDIADFLLVEKW